jgi:uncharacterized membrane protein
MNKLKQQLGKTALAAASFAITAVPLLTQPAWAQSIYHNQLTHPLFTADYQSEVTMLMWSSTNVLVAYQDLTFPPSPDPQLRRVSYACSTSSGYVWLDRKVLRNPAGDPVLGRNTANGNIYFTYITPHDPSAWANPFLLQVMRSTDDGHTWPVLRDMASIPLFSNVNQQSWDKPHLVVDNKPGAGQGTVYLAALRNVYLEGSGQNYGIYVMKSTDHGESWSALNNDAPLAPLEKNASDITTRLPNGVCLVVGTDTSRTLYVFWGEGTRTGSSATEPWNYAIKMRKSTNGGASFGSTITIKTLAGGATYADGQGDLSLGATYFQTDCYPRAVAHPTDGNQVFVVYSEKGSDPDKANIILSRTTNQGSGWTHETISDGSTDAQYQPVIAIQPAGKRLFTGFASINAAGTSIGIKGRLAKLSGTSVTWQTQFNVSDVNFGVHAGGGAGYMGHYDAAAADDLAFTYAWGDNRNAGAGQHSNVRYARIPIVPDSYQLAELSTYGVYASGEGMNNNAEIVGYALDAWSWPYTYSAEKYTAGGTSSLETTGNSNDPLYSPNSTFAYGVNYMGALVGAYTPYPFNVQGHTWKWAFRKKYGAPEATRLEFPFSQLEEVVPTWINQNEHAVGYGAPSGTTRAAYWPPSSDSATDIGTLDVNYAGTSIAFGINKAGRIVGQAYKSSGVNRAFRTAWIGSGSAHPYIQPLQWTWNSVTMENDDLGTLSGNSAHSSFAWAIAETGATVGAAQIANGNWHAYLCGPDSGDISNLRKIIPADDLGTLGGNSSQALAIDANGNFVLGTSDTATGSGVFVHYSGEKTMRALLPLTPGLWSWSSPAPIGVTKDGRIGGHGANSSGLYRAFLLTPVVN